MTKVSFHAIAMTIAVLFGLSNTNAQGNGPWSFQADTLFLRAHTSFGTPNDNVTGFDAGERLSLSHVGDNNLGARLTWFNWDHGGAVTGVGNANFDTTNLDFDVFKRLDLTNLTNIEILGGVRYNDTESNFGPLNGDFTGFGGLFGVRATVKTSDSGRLYAKAKWAILMGNGQDAVPGNFDVVRNQNEIGFGYELNYGLGNGMTLTPRIGAEWINFEGSGPVGISDVGLGGFLFGVGLSF